MFVIMMPNYISKCLVQQWDMNINIPKMHLSEGKNIHVIYAQQNYDTQYYEWIWSTESSGNLQTCTSD